MKGSGKCGKKSRKIKRYSVIFKKIRRNWQTLKHRAVGHVEHETVSCSIQLLHLYQELETVSCVQSNSHSKLFCRNGLKHDGLIFPNLAGETKYQSA